jgi:hypothetical protein
MYQSSVGSTSRIATLVRSCLLDCGNEGSNSYGREPSPTTECERLWPGHVGYIVQGRFRFLFDASQKSVRDRDRGHIVPQDFQFPVSLGPIQALSTLPAGKPVHSGFSSSSEVQAKLDVST